MKDLELKKIELETLIKNFTYPLTHSQSIRLDHLKKELNKINTQLFIENYRRLKQ